MKLQKNIDDIKKNPLAYKQLTTMFDFLVAGEGGKAVVIDKDKLSAEERKKFDDGWQKNAFNQYASDMISLHRTLPDVRDPE